MKLYLAPGACSLADHIALHEADLEFERVTVDLKTKTTESGEDYRRINPKGYVPALVLDDGQMLTENIAILSWITDQASGLMPEGPLGRYRLLETLAYISTEVHKSFKPFFSPDADEAQKAKARETIEQRLGLLSDQVGSDYLFGAKASAADAYLYVMLRWSKQNRVSIPAPLAAFIARMESRPAVKLALHHEGLSQPA